MKRIFTLFLVISCLVMLSACKQTNSETITSDTPTVTGVVKQLGSQSILIENENGEYWVSRNEDIPDTMTPCKVGDEIIIYFDGLIAESYPMQILNVYAIIVK